MSKERGSDFDIFNLKESLIELQQNKLILLQEDLNMEKMETQYEKNIMETKKEKYQIVEKVKDQERIWNNLTERFEKIRQKNKDF